VWRTSSCVAIRVCVCFLRADAAHSLDVSTTRYTRAALPVSSLLVVFWAFRPCTVVSRGGTLVIVHLFVALDALTLVKRLESRLCIHVMGLRRCRASLGAAPRTENLFSQRCRFRSLSERHSKRPLQSPFQSSSRYVPERSLLTLKQLPSYAHLGLLSKLALKPSAPHSTQRGWVVVFWHCIC
jgi:hypothetical protein